MEYFIGTLLGIASVLISFKIIKTTKKPNNFKLPYTQARIHSLISPAIPIMEMLEKLKPRESQSAILERSKTIRVLVMGDQAYWIKDNKVYEAVVEGNYIDNESAKVVDIINMDDIQLDKMKFIIEKLTEGNDNDSGNTGH